VILREKRDEGRAAVRDGQRIVTAKWLADSVVARKAL
jgi:hypothetical protein